MSEPLKTIALIGNPNVGKTTLFNALTGLRHSTANYPGVTVEKKWGKLKGDPRISVYDLPGTYSLEPKSPDEEVVRNVLLGKLPGEKKPDLLVSVVDANNFSRNLYLMLQVLSAGIPIVLVLNMWDEALQSGKQIDLGAIQKTLGIEAVATEANLGIGMEPLRQAIQRALENPEKPSAVLEFEKKTVAERYQLIDRLTAQFVKEPAVEIKTLSHKIDDVLTHPFLGWVIFCLVMAVIFQSIFSWATPLMDLISGTVDTLGRLASGVLPDGPLESLIVDGVIAGVGNVIIFVPQIFLLFLFIAVFEDFGYMARAAFVLDRVMKKFGLNGKAFLPLLSSFACAIPGIMATRTIPDKKDRLATIITAPLMSCSARLPVYALLIGAFIPAQTVWGLFNLKGLTLFAMYFLSIFAGLAMAALFRKTLLKGRQSPFLLELPPYRIPRAQNVLLVMWDRGREFIKNAGTIIFFLSIVLWFLASYPKNHEFAPQFEAQRTETVRAFEGHELEEKIETINRREMSANLQYSFAGRLGHLIEPLIRPLGFDWKIGVGLIASFAAREVMVSTLAIIYNVGDDADETSTDLMSALQQEKDPVTGKPVYTPLVAICIMVFFVLACQCMSTVAVIKRETGGWFWPLFVVGYMTVLAWLGAFSVRQIGLLLGFE